MLRQTRLFDRRVYAQLVPGREGFADELPYTALRTLPAGPSDAAAAHVAAVRALRRASARLYVGHEKIAGELLVLYTAADEVALAEAVALGEQLGGELASYGPYLREPPETDRETNIPPDARGATDTAPEEARPFTPHVTVARPERRSGGDGGNRRVRVPDAFLALDLDAPWSPREAVLMESLGGPQGSRYEPVARFPFSADPA
jgi:hypothetical protein